MTELFRIKPLEWEAFEDDQTKGYRATIGLFGAVVIRSKLEQSAQWVETKWEMGTSTWSSCASPEEGKQLAEQHWRAYIKQALEPHGSCLWKYDPDGYWKTGCGNAFVISNEEDLITNGFHFCHACGKRIEERPLSPAETEQ